MRTNPRQTNRRNASRFSGVDSRTTRKYFALALQSVAGNKTQCNFYYDLATELDPANMIPANERLTGNVSAVMDSVQVHCRFAVVGVVGATQLPIEVGCLLLTVGTYPFAFQANLSSTDQDMDAVLTGANFLNSTSNPYAFRVRRQTLILSQGAGTYDYGQRTFSWNIKGPFAPATRQGSVKWHQLLGFYCVYPTTTNNATPGVNGTIVEHYHLIKVNQGRLLKGGTND